MQHVHSYRQAYINQTYFQISQIHLDINANSSVLPPIISELRRKNFHTHSLLLTTYTIQDIKPNTI